MKYLHVNYSLNKSYNIHEHVFIDLAEKILNEIEGLKVTKNLKKPFKITINKKGNDFSLSARLSIIKGFSVSNTVRKFITHYESQCYAISKMKPSNIKVLIGRN